MGRKSVNEAGEFARQIAHAIEVLRQRRGLTNQELYEAAGMSRSYYYNRSSGVSQFGLNDLESLAAPLGVDAFEIIDFARRRLASATERSDELARRLRILRNGILEDGSDYSVASLRAAASHAGIELPQDPFDSLCSGGPASQPSDQLLRFIAQHWSIAPAFLLDLNDNEAFELTLAQLDFRLALRETGASSSAARAVGEVSAAALRAIAQSLRSIPPMDSTARD